MKIRFYEFVRKVQCGMYFLGASWTCLWKQNTKIIIYTKCGSKDESHVTSNKTLVLLLLKNSRNGLPMPTQIEEFTLIIHIKFQVRNKLPGFDIHFLNCFKQTGN